MRDFTFRSYSSLVETLRNKGYSFKNIHQYIEKPDLRSVVLRHDVDSWPRNALRMAQIEASEGIASTYYFRRSWQSFSEKVLTAIRDLGHEIGYHYEDLASFNGDYMKAIKSFERNLVYFRKYYPIKTIAMHGRPLSQWDSKDLWKEFDYRDYGIVTEPYLDIDYTQVAYLTDTGNCWDGEQFSVRDHVRSDFKISAHSTNDLIGLINRDKLPDRVLFNIHPARWNDNLAKWLLRYYVLTMPKFQAKKWLKQKRSCRAD